MSSCPIQSLRNLNHQTQGKTPDQLSNRRKQTPTDCSTHIAGPKTTIFEPSTSTVSPFAVSKPKSTASDRKRGVEPN